MSLIDVEALMAAVVDSMPCGPELRGQPEFRDIEDAPGSFSGMSAVDLTKVVARCADMLARTKDQMPAIVAVQAALRAGDMATAAAALDFIARVAETYWDDYHPGPASERAIGRLNELSALARPAAMPLPLDRLAMAQLAAPSARQFTAAMLSAALAPVREWTDEDEQRLRAQMESGALSATAGRIARANHEGARHLRSLMVSLSDTARAADAAAGTLMEGVDADAGRPLALAVREQVADHCEQLGALNDRMLAIRAVFDNRLGETPDFAPVLSRLQAMITTAKGFLSAFPEPSEASEPEVVAAAIEQGTGASMGGQTAAVSRKPFSAEPPRTRADVKAALAAIMSYYDQHEPTSPVPLMLKRVQDWVDMDFYRLMKEIAPGAADEARRLLAMRDD